MDCIIHAPGDLAEQYGAFIAAAALDAMYSEDNYDRRAAILQAALLDLCGGTNLCRATSGFAALMVGAMERAE
ncbi:MAG: hypothetical protein ACREXG_00880 [Polaromonas sp.]